MTCYWPIKRASCPAPEPDPDAGDEIEGGQPAFETVSAETQTEAERMAVDLLWNWTGRSFGTCPHILRPCPSEVSPEGVLANYPAPGQRPWYPALLSGRWYNLGCGTCGGDSCSCQLKRAIRLPSPLYSVENVIIEGEPFTDWRRSGRALHRTDGLAWPSFQNLALPPGDPGTWEIECTLGVPVPEGGQIAAGVLADEIEKALCHDSTCQLPQRVQTITRQGVTVGLLDSMDDLDEGKTGLWLVDSWVASVTRSPRRSRVYSPDVRPQP